MDKASCIIQFSKNLPGFYGYRASIQNLDIVIDQLIFELSDQDVAYRLTLFLNSEQRVLDSEILIRHADLSIEELLDENPDHASICRHRNKLVAAFNEL